MAGLQRPQGDVLSDTTGGRFGRQSGCSGERAVCRDTAGQVVANTLGALVLWGWLRAGSARIRLSVRATRLQWPLMQDILRVGAVACLLVLLKRIDRG